MICTKICRLVLQVPKNWQSRFKKLNNKSNRNVAATASGEITLTLACRRQHSLGKRGEGVAELGRERPVMGFTEEGL